MVTRIGMIGTGGFSRMHADLLHRMEDVQIGGVCGTSLKKASVMAAGFSKANGYDQIEEMLDKEELDGVYVCVPPKAHGRLELELIKRRIPFFVEKPIGIDLETPKEIMRNLEETPLITSVGYHFRYQEIVDKLKDLLKNHQIGMVTGNWNGEMPGVAWWRNQEASGGQFMEQTTHIVDLLRYLAGEVQELNAYFGHRVMKNKYEDVSVSDVGTVSFRLKSGAVANISNTCILPEEVSEINLTFYTDKGIIKWTPTYLSVRSDGAETIYQQKGNPYILENKAFIQAIRTNNPSLIRSDYADAFKTQEVTHAALQSAEMERSFILHN